MHRQGADLKDKALGLCRQEKVNYMVTQGGGIPGDSSSGIPRAFLYDWTGKCVAEGHPSELYGKIDELMKVAPHYLTGGRDFKSDDVQKVAKKLPKNRDYGDLVGDLSKLEEKLEGSEKEEASYLKGRLVDHGQRLWDRAEANVSDSPLMAELEFKELSKLYGGHELGDKASEKLKELKKDKDFQEEVKAFKYLAAIEEAAGDYKGAYAPEHPANRPVIAKCQALYARLKKKHPESKAVSQAEALIKGLVGES